MIETLIKLYDVNKVSREYIYPSLLRISSMVSYIISEVKSYYYNSHRYVKRPNLLVSLIEALEIDLSKPPEEVYSYLEATGIYVANSLGIITTVNRNEKPFTNVITTDAYEYFIALNDSVFIPTDKLSLTEPVKCLYHTVYDFYFTHPKEYKNNTIYDFYIYSIDIKKLGMSYYYWAKSELILGNDIDPSRFVYCNIITDMIPRLFELASLNLFIHFYKFDTKVKLKNYNPFEIPNYINYIYKTYNYYKKELSHGKNNYSTILYNLPTFIFNNTFVLLDIPNENYNKRNSWIMEATRLPYVIFLLQEFPHALDRDLITEIKKQLLYNKRNKYYDFEDKTTKDLIKPIFTKTEKLLKRI